MKNLYFNLIAVLAAVAIFVPLATGKEYVKKPFHADPPFDRFEDFEGCVTGRFQSPIDITEAVPVDMKELKFFYHTMDKLIVGYDGRNVIMPYDRGSGIAKNGTLLELREIRLHAPSEHTFRGKRFAMELEFIHKSSRGKLAVISVIIKEGKYNASFGDIVAALPFWIGGERLILKEFDVNELMPKSRKYYKYTGSLTSPPCTENVPRYIFKNPVEFSAKQIEDFKKTVGENNRPIHPTNGRRVRAAK